MQDRPNWQQLLEAIAEHLQRDLIPAIDDRGLRFRTRIAANLLEIVQREHVLAPEQAERERRRLEQLLGADPASSSLEELTQELFNRVAAGEYDHGPQRARLMEHLQATAVEKLRIANPKFLARLEAQDQDRSS